MCYHEPYKMCVMYARARHINTNIHYSTSTYPDNAKGSVHSQASTSFANTLNAYWLSAYSISSGICLVGRKLITPIVWVISIHPRSSHFYLLPLPLHSYLPYLFYTLALSKNINFATSYFQQDFFFKLHGKVNTR